MPRFPRFPRRHTLRSHLFHFHSVTDSIFCVEHVFRPTPPIMSRPAVAKFSNLKLITSSCLNDIESSSDMIIEICLSLCLDGHGLTHLFPSISASYGSNLIEAALVRVQSRANPSVSFYRWMTGGFRPYLWCLKL